MRIVGIAERAGLQGQAGVKQLLVRIAEMREAKGDWRPRRSGNEPNG